METQNLTDEQINVMVTEAVGLYVHREGRVMYASSRPEPDFQRRFFAYEPLIQKFSTSLDACATFEATFNDDELDWYGSFIVSVVGWDRSTDHVGKLATAAPRQRCIAFLRMKGVL